MKFLIFNPSPSITIQTLDHRGIREKRNIPKLYDAEREVEERAPRGEASEPVSPIRLYTRLPWETNPSEKKIG
jgi:hypothetical protein